jgi:radical SAM protein with 4Fe4S-binding SPASM domain
MRHYKLNLDYWKNTDYEESQTKLTKDLRLLHKDKYEQDELIILEHNVDYYVGKSKLGLVLRNIQTIINEENISNCFVLIRSTNPNIAREITLVKQISIDPMPIGFELIEGEFTTKLLVDHPASQKEFYAYDSVNPLKISLENISERECNLLTKSKTFCMYPWVHLHAYPTGEAYPCCMAEMESGKVGNCQENTLEEIWNSPEQRKFRVDMLTETPNAACGRCYEQEESGFFSGRQSANKHHGHLVERVLETKPDGTYETFEMTYWDIRFSNLCNLSCRSCGHIFSSSWHKDQSALAGPEWAKNNSVLNYAGRFETDMMEQLMEHLDHVEQIYFAGGEPLMMDEHYVILEELESRGRFDVRLIYNSNFTQVKLKDRMVFDYWKKFNSVSVGASLDAMGPRAEYIRKGTKWNTVEDNRRQMMEVCPNVDFYISPTLSIMNAMHLPDFHKEWVGKGLIKPQDLNVNILQDPDYFRLDIAPQAYKEKIKEKYEKHLEWLRPMDKLNRATVGFESALQYMDSTDNSHLLEKFWKKTNQLDGIRKENILDFIPELGALK